MPQTFVRWQAAYAARHIPTFPFAVTSDRKRPLVRGYQRIGLQGSQQLALKGLGSDGLACMAGARNKLTVIDIDARGSEAERLLADALREYGVSKFIVRTGGGGFHAYYRHNGENRRIRPDPRRPIDLLGGGIVVLPPSRGTSRSYEIIEGTLDDLTALQPLRSVAVPSKSVTELRGTKIGERDQKYWRHVARMAHQARSQAELMEIAMEMNEMLAPPLTQSEIDAKVKYWWDKTARGQNRFGQGKFVLVDHARIDDLMMAEPDAFVLLTFLNRHHWGRDFALANETCTLMPQGGWRRQRFTAARAVLIERGFLRILQHASLRPPRPMICRIVAATDLPRG